VHDTYAMPRWVGMSLTFMRPKRLERRPFCNLRPNERDACATEFHRYETQDHAKKQRKKRSQKDQHNRHHLKHGVKR
jgi:hypothetical protein